jgi:hypothetical protein
MVSGQEQRRTEFARLFWQSNSFSVIYREMHRKKLDVPLSTLKERRSLPAFLIVSCVLGLGSAPQEQCCRFPVGATTKTPRQQPRRPERGKTAHRARSSQNSGVHQSAPFPRPSHDRCPSARGHQGLVLDRSAAADQGRTEASAPRTQTQAQQDATKEETRVCEGQRGHRVGDGGAIR